MDDIVKKIIEIENKASDIVKLATEQKENINQKIDQIADQIAKDIDEKCNLKIEGIKNQEEKTANEQIEKSVFEAGKKHDEMKKKYDEQKNDWVDKIVKNIVG